MIDDYTNPLLLTYYKFSYLQDLKCYEKLTNTLMDYQHL